MKKRRRRCNDSSDERVDDVLKALRLVQNLSNCTTSTLNLVLKHLQPFLKGCEHVEQLKMGRVRARKQSCYKRSLHGCVGCDDHVFGPTTRDKTCPKCGHARFNVKGKPHEGMCCLGFCPWVGPLLCWVMHAQNHEVMKEFRARQRPHLK